MSRALRFQFGLPLSYWGDCVLCAVHIINRLPTAALNFQTPYETLYNELPSYDQLRTFDCLALATNPNRDTDKFSPRGIPCVFLGYPSNQKGFKLLNLMIQKVFVSRDVTFHEHIFPFIIFPTPSTPPSPSISINPLILPDDSVSTSLPSSPALVSSLVITTFPLMALRLCSGWLCCTTFPNQSQSIHYKSCHNWVFMFHVSITA